MKRTAVLLLALALLLAALQYKLWYGHAGQHAVVALHAQVTAQEEENSKLQARNDALAAEVADLKSGGAAVEERARSELGLVKPGETFYRVIDHATTAPTPATTVATLPPADAPKNAPTDAPTDMAKDASASTAHRVTPAPPESAEPEPDTDEPAAASPAAKP
jgi:cell division protein FtsB